MKIIIACASALAISGCVTSGIVPMGQDTYMASKTGVVGFSSHGSLKAELFREAAAYCASQQKVIQVVNTSGVTGTVGQRNPEAEIQFMCLREGDPELVRPKMRKEADTVIETRNR